MEVPQPSNKLDMDSLYQLFDELSEPELKNLIHDIEQEIDLRNYKAARVIKIKEMMDQERNKLKKELDEERLKFKQQLEKDKNRIRVKSVVCAEEDEEESDEEESEEESPKPKPKKKPLQKRKVTKANK